MIRLNLDAADCKNAADMLELYFFQNIRDDPDMDNLDYIRSMLHVIDELYKAAKGVEVDGRPA